MNSDGDIVNLDDCGCNERLEDLSLACRSCNYHKLKTSKCAQSLEQRFWQNGYAIMHIRLPRLDSSPLWIYQHIGMDHLTAYYVIT
jgi:hypothetical protein